ncbi:MAG: Uma2 family endonuclease [Armatimonadetes bacterium]|nr:Uma2 family endonuclease [Armatimonadota bacterium]
MATVVDAPAAPLTYEAYMAEPQVEGRYDIINGVRIFMPGASWDHQTISGNIGDLFRQFARRSGAAKTVSTPFDVLIRRVPKVQTRQPDVLLISLARLAQGGGILRRGPLPVAPELVVEIVSDSETQQMLHDKIKDYCAIGVDECWVVRPDARTVEVLRLTPVGSQSVAVCDDTQTAASRVFPALAVPVAEVFAP